MLKVESISKSYGKNLAVDDLSFEVQDGEIFGLLGENGAGKTTTFRIIMGLLDADHGQVTLNGKKIDYSITDKIGFVTEERSLLGKMTVKEQILFYGSLKGMREEQILKELDRLLKKFDILEYKDRKIKELSKGNQQKIQFISAIINHPKLLILDEPFTGLDPINVQMLKEAIFELQKEGCSIIFSSHQMEHIEEFCEKLVILVKGKVVLEGYLQKIKDAYPKKKILVKATEVSRETFTKIPGVTKVTKEKDHYLVEVGKEEMTDRVFEALKGCHVQKFDILEPNLNEIFIEKVGRKK